MLRDYISKLVGCDVTVHIPGEGIPELLPLNLHIQADRNKDFRLGGIFMDHCWVMVIKAGKTMQHKLDISPESKILK